jgi:hypothetical protein
MNLSRCGIVITSIYDTGWIERISENILSSNEQDNVKIFYISDNKTPAVCLEKIKVASKKGIKFWAPSKDEQIIFQKKFGIENFILENSDHRRNIGYLKAYYDEVDFVISMDDDNFPVAINFIDQHRQMLLKKDGLNRVDSSNNFFNNCTLLDSNTFVHPRGYPTNRKQENFIRNSKASNLKIAINAGMWTISPDVDAISWLVKYQEFNNITKVDQVVLGEDTYCPINSQNTSLIREMIPAYYFVRMNYDIGGGLKFDRLGDIYSGYFLQKIAKSLDYSVSFGMPLVSHERNSHDYLNDANAEWGCFRTIDAFSEWLINLRLTNESVTKSFEHMAEELDEFASIANFRYVGSATSGFYHQMAFDMKKWIKLFKC